jgi:transposase
LHLICDGNGLPLAVTVSPGQEHETQQVCDLLQQVIDQQRLPEKLAGDKGYSADWIRDLCGELGIRPVIARRVDEVARTGRFDRKAYRRRNVIERCINSLKWFRRVATRYEKLALHYLGMLKVAILYRFLGR